MTEEKRKNMFPDPFMYSRPAQNITPEAAERVIEKVTFEAVNSEIDRELASWINATLSAQAARIAELEAALDSEHASVGHNIRRFWSGKALEMAKKNKTARNEALREAAEVCKPSDFNDSDEVRVWEYVKHRILALIEGDTND